VLGSSVYAQRRINRKADKLLKTLFSVSCPALNASRLNSTTLFKKSGVTTLFVERTR
jgi:hypothetical protein